MSRTETILNELRKQNQPQHKPQSQFQDAPIFSMLKEKQQKQNSWENSGWNYEKDELAGEVQKVNDEYINQYIQNIQDYAKSAPDAYKNASYGDMNVFLEQHQHETYELKKQGDAIKKYLENNPNAYAENRQSLMDFLTSNNEAVSAYRNMLNNAEAGNSLYIPTTAEERQDRYESNQKKIDEITYNGLLEDFFLSDEDKATVDRLRKENKDYELGQGGYATTKKADEYSKVMQNEDFAKVSAERGQIPTKEDIAMFDAMNDSRTWYYDKDGVPRDSFGNELATDASGNLYNPKAQQSPVTDRLGLYLSATKDEVKDYMETLSSNTWTSVINDALDGSWDYLKDTDIGVYYYILNKEGQAAADKYLDDMKLELNRRETMSDQQRWTEKYNNSNWLQKIGMNAETLPAKFLSGTAGFVDNTVKALTGNEVNPYDAVHSGTYFTNTVRGETAKELDKTGFKIPGVNFTLGDIYQTGMSRLDSALATAIFGGGGTVFLGMQAAEQEALKLYEQGASDTQITLGALSAGLAETIFEYASFGELQELKNASKGEIEGWAKRALKNAWSQGVDEAREETLTGLTNLVTNALIMGKDSDLAEMYKENKDEAFGLFKDLLQQTAHDAFGGFIGGAGAGIVQATRAYLQNKNNAAATKAQQAQQMQQAAQNRLEALGETDGAKAVAEAIAKQVSGEELSVTDELLINGSKYGNQVMQELSGNVHPQAQVVDTKTQQIYNKENKVLNEGVMKDGQRLQQNDGAGSVGNSAQGMAGVQYNDGNDIERGRQSGEVAVDAGVVRVSPELADAQKKRGTPVYPVINTTAEPQSYEKALMDGRNSDPENGWCVTFKPAKELADDNIRTFMNESGTTGFGIAQNGDIVAVFKNKNGGPKKALDTLMPIAIEQGGDRLDCYGEGLVRVYSQYGFVPVARVEFNPEYANDGWTPDKGNPYIYFMVHNGDAASVVAEKRGTYPQFTKEQLDALPTYGKENYEAAMEYRDGLLNQRNAEKNATEAGRDSALPETAVGAAKQDFTGKAGYNELLSDENSQPDRPGDVRPMEVLKTDPYGRRVTEFAANAYGAEITSNEMADRIQELIYDGALGFDTQTNKQLLDQAAKEIAADGLAKSRNKITKATFAGRTREADIAKAMLLYNTYVSRGTPSDIENASEIMVDLSTIANETGRKLQLFSMFRKMTPEGQLSTVEKSVERYFDKLNKKRSDKNAVEKFDIPNELKTAYIEAARRDSYEHSEESAEAKAIAEREIYKAAAAQVKGTLAEKLKAWRYMAMLGNVKTQVRNVFGNAIFRPFVNTKRMIGAGLEAMFVDQKNRTKAVLGVGKNASELTKWAAQDAKNVNAQELMSSSFRTGDTAANAIDEERSVFDWQLLEKVRKFTKAVPEAADGIFKNREYTLSLASFMKARGYTASDLQEGKVPEAVLNEGRSYAANEALKATFNDVNELSRLMSARYQGDSALGKTVNAVFEGVMPFRKTPANIIARAVEYSPVGIVSATFDAATKLKSGKTTAANVIDKMASGLTGSLALGLGYALAKGIFGIRLRGKVDEEEERAGHKSYSIEVGEKSFDISWAAPSVIPLFIGANMVEAGNNADVSELAGFLNASALSVDPILELSCLSSLQDVVEAAKYAEEGTALYAIAANAATSYLTQYIPTLFGQFEQTTEETKNKVYTTAKTEAGRVIQNAVGRMTQRIPGVDLFQAERVDAWGETEKDRGVLEKAFGAFVSPWGYASDIDNSEVEAEIARLNKSLGNTAAAPSTPDKKISYTNKNGDKVSDYTLTAEEWSELAKKQGQEQRQIVESLIQSDMYKNLPDEYKAEAIKRAYTYAKEKARLEVIKDYTVSNANAWTQRTDDPVNDILLKAATDSIVDGLIPQSGYESVRTVQKVEAITAADDLLTAQEQADALRDVLSDGFGERYDKVIAMGYDNDDFAKVYSIYTQDQDSKDIDKDDAIKMIMRELNITKSQARKLYDAYTAPKDNSK